jgi:hypothetical protein
LAEWSPVKCEFDSSGRPKSERRWDPQFSVSFQRLKERRVAKINDVAGVGTLQPSAKGREPKKGKL